MNCVTTEGVQGYASLFVSCWDRYAVQQRDGSYRPSYQQLSLARLQDHLMGRYTLGTYVLDAAERCSFAVFDADREDGLDCLTLLADELAGQGAVSLLEASRRGGHLWIFLDQPTTASALRAWLVPYAQLYAVELYPKQESLRPGGVGSLIRLPLGVHRRADGWYPFLKRGSNGLLLPVGETVAACCAWLIEHVERVAVPSRESEEVVKRHEAGSVIQTKGLGRGAIRQWCDAQDIFQVIGQYTTVDRRGVGRCPLPGHHYRGDVHPSLQIFGGSDPHWYCYTWGRAGNVFDFLCAYHGLTAGETWARLQAGTLA